MQQRGGKAAQGTAEWHSAWAARPQRVAGGEAGVEGRASPYATADASVISFLRAARMGERSGNHSAV